MIFVDGPLTGGRGWIKRRFLGSLIVENEGKYSLNISRMESVEVNFGRLRGEETRFRFRWCIEFLGVASMKVEKNQFKGSLK